MAAGFPVKADYLTGDVLSAANMNDLAGTLNYLDPTAKGDLFPASSGTALTRLAVGANGTILTADSAETTGLKWASPAAATSGLTLITTSSPSAAASVNINNCFSATYQSYQIYYNLSATADVIVSLRLRVSGTDATTNYTSQSFTVRAAVTDASRGDLGYLPIGVVRSSGRGYGITNISNPFATAETSYTSSAQDPVSGAGIDLRAGRHSDATSYDGFTLYTSSGNFTGSIRVYGVQNS